MLESLCIFLSILVVYLFISRSSYKLKYQIETVLHNSTKMEVEKLETVVNNITNTLITKIKDYYIV
jgi:hypothetical protein